MSFGWLDKIADQVLRYSSFIGQLYYVLTFVFRLIVVTGLGSSVYGDEQSNFKCNQNAPGCEIACYNQFTLISHLRFWAFQMLAVTAPIVAFHFIATYFAGQIKKLEEIQDHINDENDDFFKNRNRHYEEEKMYRRKRIVGKYKIKKVQSGTDLKEIPINDKIRLAYFISVVIRLASEGIFLYLTYTFYNYPDYSCTANKIFQRQDASECRTNGTGLHFLWAEFPEFYPCRRLDEATGVDIACAQHVALNSHVPCWTSRAYEKTVFLRYMNVISAICFLLCAVEIVVIPLIYMQHKSNKSRVEMAYRKQQTPPPPPGPLPVPGSDYRDIREFRGRDFRDEKFYKDDGIYKDNKDYRDPVIYRDGRDFGRDKGQLIELPPLRPQPSAVYSTATHAGADYPSRRDSYYEERERPLHPPPNETSAKRYDDFKE